MGDVRFRVWFGDRAASEAELALIEEIDVTQEMDAFWEARVRMVLCLDERGTWKHRPDETVQPFSRIRIEIDPGDGRFAPLIDGPLVSVDSSLDSQPGRSTATLVVRDDSAFLNRDEEVEPPFVDRRDGDLANELFRRFEQIGDTRIDATSAPHTTTRRGTVLQFLRERARASDRHVYVLPGDERGASIGCFLADPTGAPALPKLVLAGAARSMADAQFREDPDSAERTRARFLRARDHSVASFETSAADLGLMRDLAAVPADLTPRRLLSPSDNICDDPEAAVSAQARRAGYAFRVASRVVSGCYAAILVPYQKVRIDAGATPHSGDYLITKVVHRITPSVHSQQFEAKSDSTTSISASPAAGLLGGGLSASASMGIF